MTRLNYENARRYVRTSDNSFDDLPRAGSWADQRRFMFDQGEGCTKGESKRLRNSTPGSATSAAQDDLVLLEKYVKHAEHPDFVRKPMVQQNDVIGIIKRLLARPSVSSRKHHGQALGLIERSRRLVAKHCH